MNIPRLVFLSLLFTLLPLPLPLQSIPTVQYSIKLYPADYIYRSCNTTTEYPKLCYKTLSRYTRVVQSDPARLARVAISVSHSCVRGVAAYLSRISREVDFGASPAIEDSADLLSYAADEISDSLGQMREMGSPEATGFKYNVSNVETWISAACTLHESCLDELGDVTNAEVKKKDLFHRVELVQKITYNALYFVDAYFDSLANPSPSPSP